MAVVTLVYTLITLAIVLETRRSRLVAGEATVLYRASPWPKMHLVLAVRIENYGPAVARDVTFTYWLSRADGSHVQGEDAAGSLHEALLPIGLPREALPHDPAAQNRNMDGLAEAGLMLNAEWSWRDGCRHLHKAKDSRRVAQVAEDYHGSKVLIEHFPLDSLPKIEKHLDGISDSLSEIAKAVAER
jgi:hypothetical protein